MGDNYTGLEPRDCTLHRNGIQRAWCFDCGMWCYPHDPCHGCQRPIDRAELALYRRLYWFLQEDLHVGDPRDGSTTASVSWAELNELDVLTDALDAHYSRYGFPDKVVTDE